MKGLHETALSSRPEQQAKDVRGEQSRETGHAEDTAQLADDLARGPQQAGGGPQGLRCEDPGLSEGQTS